MRLALLLLYCSICFAEDIRTLSGKVYINAMVSKVTPDGISVNHRDGVAKIPFTDLGTEMRERFHFDPAKAKEFIEKQTTADRVAERDAPKMDTKPLEEPKVEDAQTKPDVGNWKIVTGTSPVDDSKKVSATLRSDEPDKATLGLFLAEDRLGAYIDFQAYLGLDPLQSTMRWNKAEAQKSTVLWTPSTNGRVAFYCFGDVQRILSFVKAVCTAQTLFVRVQTYSGYEQATFTLTGGSEVLKQFSEVFKDNVEQQAIENEGKRPPFGEGIPKRPVKR